MNHLPRHKSAARPGEPQYRFTDLAWQPAATDQGRVLRVMMWRARYCLSLRIHHAGRDAIDRYSLRRKLVRECPRQAYQACLRCHDMYTLACPGVRR